MSDSVALHSISSVAYVNPPLSKKVAPTDVVSFIPMADVSDSGKWIGRQTRTQAEISVGYTPFQDGDLLFAKITPCMENGKGCYVEGLCNGVGYGSTEFHVLRPKPGNDGRFLYHWLQTEMVRKKAEAFMIGSAGQQRVQTSFFDQHLMPVCPYDEQQRIAEILDAVDEVIAKTAALIAKLKQINAGLLHDLLTRGIDENGHLRDPIIHLQRFKDSLAGIVPLTWTVGPLGDRVTLQRGFDITKEQQCLGDVPVVSSSGITSYHDEAKVEGPGVVIGRKGQLGDAYYIEGPFWPHDTSLWVKNFHGNLPRFIALFLKSLRLQRFDAATSVPTLNRNFIHPLIVAIPPPHEQALICDMVEAHEVHLCAEEAYHDKLRQIKKGLTHDLLTGRVRVTQAEATA